MSSLQSAIDRGDWARAAALLEAALTKQPADASLCFALGSVLRNQFRVSSKKPHNVSLLLKADKWYLQALTVSPQHGEVAAERANLATELHRAMPHLPSAQRHLAPTAAEVARLHRTAIALQPRSAVTYQRLGEWLVEWDDGRHDAALLAESTACFGSALRLDPVAATPQMALQLGLQQHRRGRWAEAASAYARALQMMPTAAETYALLGSLRYHRDRELAPAEHALRASISLRQRSSSTADSSSSATATSSASAMPDPAASSRQELVQVLQLQGRLDEAVSLSGAMNTLAAGWSMQNELALPMYLWRHLRGDHGADLRSEMTRDHGADLWSESMELFAHCRQPGIADGVSAIGRLSSEVTGCSGDCILRTRSVELWQHCKRHLGWPHSRASVGDRPADVAVPGAPAREDGGVLHLAARWGAAWEVRALMRVYGSADDTTDSVQELDASLSGAGALRWTPLHEAALNADCEVLDALLVEIGRRSVSSLSRLLKSVDLFGRTAVDLILAARPASSACLLGSLGRADALVLNSPHEDERAPTSREDKPTKPKLLSVAAIEAALASAEADKSADKSAGRAAGQAAGEATRLIKPRVVGAKPAKQKKPHETGDKKSKDVGGETGTTAKADEHPAQPMCSDADADGGEALRMGPRGWLELTDGSAAGGEQPRCDVDVWTFERGWEEEAETGQRTARPRGSATATSLRMGSRFVRDAVSLDRPVLLRGLLLGLSSRLDEWTRDAVLAAAERETFQVMQFEEVSDHSRGAKRGEMTDSHTWRRVALGDWLRETRQPRNATPSAPLAPPVLPEYIFDQSGGAIRGALGPRIQRLFPWRALLHAEPAGLYVGGNGSGNPFHYHQQTWNALVAGRKRWLLYPPNASFYSEVHPLEWLRRRAEDQETTRADAPDHATTRLQPPPLECEQRAGDVLFVPRLWGHGTVNLGEAVGVAIPFTLRQSVDYAGGLHE